MITGNYHRKKQKIIIIKINTCKMLIKTNKEKINQNSFTLKSQ